MRNYPYLDIFPGLHTHDSSSCRKLGKGHATRGTRPKFEYRMREGGPAGTGKKIRSNGCCIVTAATGTRFQATSLNAPSCMRKRERPRAA
jgi:hypothetical protein